MTLAPITLNGAELALDPAGALWWPAERMLVVADLHLEKGSALARRGAMLPPYDSRATIAALERLVARHRPARVVALGDSFHDPGGPARLGAVERGRLGRLVEAAAWIWVQGNHDPAPPAGLGGEAAASLTIGPLVFRHEPEGPAAPGEVAGHLHPKARVSLRERGWSARCFATDGRRMVLPAFGAYAGGLDVLDPAVRGLFRRGFRVFLLGRERLYAFPADRLGALG